MKTSYREKVFLAGELFGLFITVPALIYLLDTPLLLPLLWFFGALCTVILLRDPDFDRRDLWRFQAIRKEGRRILKEFGIGAGLLFLIMLLVAPQLLFTLILDRPVLWAFIMVLYPLLSVYPQELIYRAFFFHRYHSLFTRPSVLCLVNGLLFGYMHIVFHNWVALGLTTAGGVLFAYNYQRSHSVLFVSVQHALFGSLIFTLGLGQYFYNGSVGTITRSFQL